MIIVVVAQERCRGVIIGDQRRIVLANNVSNCPSHDSIISNHRHHCHRRQLQQLYILCPRCGDGAHTLEHWFLECAGTESTRRDIFGEVSPSLEVLPDHPGKAVLMSRRNL